MRSILFVAALPAVAAACTPSENAPLVFGQGTTLGVTVGAAATGQTPEFTLGYKDTNIAVIPTIVEQQDGSFTQLGGENVTSGFVPAGESEVPSAPGDAERRTSGNTYDAFSTFGQFEASIEGSKVGLGKFFATGVAAQRLSEGFACGVSRGTDGRCRGKGAYSLTRSETEE